ncbi:MAG TPA: hypothetical protein VGE72_17840 [Azospirillum sp.]
MPQAERRAPFQAGGKAITMGGTGTGLRRLAAPAPARGMTPAFAALKERLTEEIRVETIKTLRMEA